MLSDDFDGARSIGVFFSVTTMSKVLTRTGAASWTKQELLELILPIIASVAQ
jgi:hypothetical protein